MNDSFKAFTVLRDAGFSENEARGMAKAFVPDPIPLTFKSNVAHRSVPGVVETSNQKNAILVYAASKNGHNFTNAEIIAKFGMNAGSVNGALSELHTEGRIRRVNRGLYMFVKFT